MILYDNDGFGALRAWWLFQAYNYGGISLMTVRFEEYSNLGFPCDVGPEKEYLVPNF